MLKSFESSSILESSKPSSILESSTTSSILEPCDPSPILNPLSTLSLARTWPHSRKLLTTILIGSLRFISSLAASSPSYALPSISTEFGTTHNKFLSALPLSAFILGYVLGPLVITPLSSTFGRVRVLQASSVWFVVFNTAAGFATGNAELVAWRFWSGVGGSGPVTLGIGILSDCWTAQERTRMISVYTLPVQLGPAVAPIMGAFITRHLSWRWSFWVVSIASCVFQMIGWILLRETHTPYISSISSADEQEVNPTKIARHLLDDLHAAFLRPIKIFYLHATTQLLALYAAFTYAIVFLSFVSFHSIWVDSYHQRSDLASLNFIALAVGEIVGSISIRPFNEYMYARLSASSSTNQEKAGETKQSPPPSPDVHPEFRVPALLFGAILLPTGLLLFGWSASHTLFPLIPNLGVAIYAAGEVIVLQFTSLYIADVYESRSSEALAGAYMLRCVVGFSLSLVGGEMMEVLGVGWANTLLAGLCVLVGWPLSWMIWRFGQRLREVDAGREV
ncbi:unnamed protein product [Zymoseptoria tritici ST99CH_1A5]|uniref:Major facilitator superfamily (MFS) profile domain-containing protein n=2 Tax=Zymoseptoria tritici TaxID=1047171 RepID=A0A1Y6L700_ZYMTR|nr:unnamed protein product [Zymoseptoria tritici ST99CH_3D1]SMY19369.1 unnamed protein product [Zymoseptoria tritici ST99CH_1A5]